MSNLNLKELIFMFYTAISLKTDYAVISMVMNHTFRETSNIIKETNMILYKLWIYKPALRSSDYGRDKGVKYKYVSFSISFFFF